MYILLCNWINRLNRRDRSFEVKYRENGVSIICYEMFADSALYCNMVTYVTGHNILTVSPPQQG